MQNYIRYEIEQRLYSANVIVGVYETLNDKGKLIEKRDIIICPVLKKEDGDIYATIVVSHLNQINFVNLNK